MPPYHLVLTTRALLHAYCTGVYGSRRDEKRMHEDVALRYLAAQQTPDHRAIAEFRRRHLRTPKELFQHARAAAQPADVEGSAARAKESKGEKRLNPDAAAHAAHAVEGRGTDRVSRYLWLVLISAFLAWLFDAMALNIFTLVLFPSVSQLTHTTDVGTVARIGGLIVGIKLFAWGAGGVLFGVVADRFGRARTMMFTILIYAVFTGLSALARSWVELAVLQAAAAVGIGGEWSAGAALVAETWPERLRTRAMQFMQLAFSVGFFVAAVVNTLIGPFGWRWVFVAGAVPALLTLVVRRYVREPERWRVARSQTTRPSTAADPASSPAYLVRIFRPGLRTSTIVGTVTALAMMVGAFAGTTWIPSWIQQLLGPARVRSAPAAVGDAIFLMNGGAIVGYVVLMWLVDWVGRRWSYFLFCAGALVSSLYLFTRVHSYGGVLMMMPLYGLFAIGGFGNFAAYLPELFPTTVRATGQGFCWNMSRAMTGFGPLVGGLLVATLGSFPASAAIVSLAFTVGLVAIWFGPETRGRPLPD